MVGKAKAETVCGCICISRGNGERERETKVQRKSKARGSGCCSALTWDFVIGYNSYVQCWRTEINVRTSVASFMVAVLDVGEPNCPSVDSSSSSFIIFLVEKIWIPLFSLSHYIFNKRGCDRVSSRVTINRAFF